MLPVSAATPAIAGSGKPADAADTALDAARQFEALLIKQLLSSVKISGGGGAQSDFVDSMWRDQISSKMSEQGLGLAPLIARQLAGGDATSRSQGPLALNPLNTLPAQPGLRLYQNLLPEPERFSDPAAFVRDLKPHLNRAAAQLGVSPQILLAQSALETGWGQHLPGTEGGQNSRNLFGIKADASWQGARVDSVTREFDGQAFETRQQTFRQYASFADSINDYVTFLRSQPRYQQALQHGGSDKNFIQGLKSAGYATDPQYVDKVLDIAAGQRLNALWSAL